MRCICCARNGPLRHHVVYRQHCGAATHKDERNLVPVAKRCHDNHHSAFRRFELRMLPDSVFEFAVEALGQGPAFEYLSRRYAGSDPRLDALLTSESA